MTETGGPARRALRRSLWGGAAYDVALGLFIWILGRPVMAALGFPLPDHALFYFTLSALPLFLLPGLYLAAARARDIDGFRSAVLWTRGGGGCLVILCAAAFRPQPIWMFAAVGIVDLGWAALHAVLWRR